MRSVQKGFQIEVMTARTKQDVLYSRCAVVPAVQSGDLEFVGNPLIDTDIHVVARSAMWFIRTLSMGARGATHISALAVLFIGWAYSMTKLSAQHRSRWPGRSTRDVLKWVKRQNWVKPNGLFGVGIHLIMKAAADGNKCTYTTVISTAELPFQRYFRQLLRVPVMKLFRMAVGDVRSIGAYVAPELEILNGVSVSRLLRCPDTPLEATFRTDGGGDLLVWLRSAARSLYTNGFSADPISGRRCREGSVIGFHLKRTTHPFYYMQVAPALYHMYAARAVMAVTALLSKRIELVVKPYAGPPPGGFRHVKDLFTKNDGVLVGAEYMTWFHLYFWVHEANVTKLTLCGDTSMAIQLRNNNGCGSVWLELMRGRFATVIPELLKVSDVSDTTIKDCQHAVALAAILDDCGTLDPSNHCSVHTPAKGWFADDITVVDAARQYNQ